VTALDAAFTVMAGGFRLEAELRLEEGVLVLFGPSGAGKSLCLAVLTGLLRPESGHVRVRDRSLSGEGVFVPTHERRVGYVPQHHSLFPWATVAQNVGFGLPRAERGADSPRVAELLEALQIAHLADDKPPTLSGGERQRVALARAIAVRPDLLLLDEPFASVDQSGRVALRKQLREFLTKREIPAVFVTHSVEEALELADRVVRFERGRTTVSGPPGEVMAAEVERLGAELDALRARLGE